MDNQIYQDMLEYPSYSKMVDEVLSSGELHIDEKYLILADCQSIYLNIFALSMLKIFSIYKSRAGAYAKALESPCECPIKEMWNPLERRSVSIVKHSDICLKSYANSYGNLLISELRWLSTNDSVIIKSVINCANFIRKGLRSNSIDEDTAVNFYLNFKAKNKLAALVYSNLKDFIEKDRRM